MDNYCAFSEDHKCLKLEDYELTRHELEEADNLCHGKLTATTGYTVRLA